jgi:Rrf2 family protein
MTFSHKTDYALTAVRYLAGLRKGEVASITRIARECGIPREFLAKVLRYLVRAGVLKAIQGVSGGYELAKPAQKITFMEVVEAVDGKWRLSLLTSPPSNNPLRPGPSDRLLEATVAKLEQEARKQLCRMHFGRFAKTPLERTRVEQTGPEPF